MTDKTFEIAGIVPADMAHPGLALALARSGATGLLDLEFVTDTGQARNNLRRLFEATDARIGLRVVAAQASLAAEIIATAGARALTVVLAGAATELPALRKKLQLRDQDFCLAEITSADDVDTVTPHCAALLLRGHESGGWVGDDTSYILLQKVRRRTQRPIYVQGGIGVRAAAACRVAGAAGVVLDDTLLLLAESPLTETQKSELGRLNGAETRLLGELLGRPCRVYGRPNSPALKAAEELTRTAEGGSLTVEEWTHRLSESLGWSADSSRVLPLGQGIGLAAQYRKQYRSVARLVQAMRRASRQQAEQAAELGFIGEDGPLARSHGTRFPLCQGPMTRVSDSPEFAVDVAKGGALPFLALALMRGPQVAQMLEQTRAQIGDRPWGVGMLGFVPHALREEQCAEIWKCKPPFALIAGGRPDQAAEFEKRGIATYIHAPAPALLKMYLEQGARRFVFEGRECGGHIGPLASFPLWEQMIEVLLTDVPAGEESKVHVLFAGGIHDATSGAMIAAMAAPLAARGMKVGALMGTAYLFTQEIVQSGAVVEGFQAEALKCHRTMSLETGPGHATRCVDTKFAHDFYETRKRLIGEGKSAEEIRDILEDLNLGRLRIASKGVDRSGDGKIVPIDPQQQLTDGMYMIGQVATLRDHVLSVEALHTEVSHDGQAMLETLAAAHKMRVQAAQPSDVAIVGIGVLLPKADSPQDYWDHIVHKIGGIGEVPSSRWDWKQYFDADRKARDKVYSRWGGFIDEVAFDPMRFGIPPKSMKSIDPMQLLTLEVASRALDDAGYRDGGFARETTSIILGAGGGLGDLGLQYGVRAELPRFVDNISDETWDRLPEWTEESFAGTLLNVAAGRVANRLDFGGVNFTVDAACASSLAAISLAVGELESGRSSMVLAGGIDTVQSPFGYLCFSKTQALSPSGQPKTFDKNADGIAISEGLAVVALKRLADAERDGDRIYAVIKAVSGSSDGKALGLTAPRPEGQVRALHRAYAKAGFSPSTLSLIEAHGTGTAVGDRAEAQTITSALIAESAAPKSVALGSVKTLIGHTKASAGVAGLIKVTLSLYHRVLPAHHGVSQPIDTIADPASPAYLLKDARPWLAHPDHPRRGGVSAFGFGGTNFHAVLEEYASTAPVIGQGRWPAELLLLRAADSASLARDLEKLRGMLQPGSRVVLGELAFALARAAEARRGAALTLCLVATQASALLSEIDAVVAHLHDASKPLPPTARLNRQTPAQSPDVAFLFPGQGAQYVNMGRESALYLDDLRSALELADRSLRSEFPERLSSYVMPPAAFDPAAETAQQQALTDTRVAQPAIGALALGYLRLAHRLGLNPVATAGHSYGEYAALHAAGVFDAESLLYLSAVRGRAMAEAATTSAPGTMAAVQAKRERIAELIEGIDGVRIANHNAPEQSVISGARAGVEQAVAKLAEAGIRAVMLPVSGAFHTELVAAARTPLSTAIRATQFAPAQCPVYSNSRGAPYPEAPDAIQALLDDHLLNSVEFVSEIEAMYAAGCRVFLELGPKSICSNMVRQILGGREALAVSLDAGGSLRGTLQGIADLCAAGVQLDILNLFDGRDLALLDLNELAQMAQPLSLPQHTWMVSGGCARQITDPQIRTGRQPALNKATAEAAQAKRAAELQAAAQSAAAAAPASAASPMPSSTVAPVNAALNSEAVVAYQQTMRQFLQLQERVVQQFLGGGAPSTSAALPQISAPLPIANTTPSAVAAPATSRSAVAPAPAPAPAAVSPSPAIVKPVPSHSSAPRVDFKAVLLGIVAERTGYPEDMLGLDADLEADLGIDSIKRVEILGAFQKALPGDFGGNIQTAMERFTRAKTLNTILNEVRALAPETGGAEIVEPAATAADARVTTIDYKSILLGIVAERTGYPEDMLGLDADLEADLGIDSIKRVEILGAFQKALPGELGGNVQAAMERFTRAKTLNAILAEIQALAPAVAAPVAVAAAAAVAATPAIDFKALLLGIVAERTGYPEDMLGLDADLEADLGIDSIKRVEILGAFQKALPGELGGNVQAAMERFTRAKTLNAILAEIQALAPAVAAPVAVAAAAAVAATPAIDFKALLLGIVAERTGYPDDMLGLDADLEADLGIDSIKRVEILGAFQKALPGELGGNVQAAMERFTRAKTLNAILAEIQALTPSPSTPQPAMTSAAMTSATTGAAASTTIPRYVLKPTPAPLSGDSTPLSGLVLLLGDSTAISSTLIAAIKAEGATPVMIAATEPERVRDAITEARARHGAVQAMLYLHGLSPQVAESLAQWREKYQRNLLTLFHAAQALGDDIRTVHLIAATRLGGTFGRDTMGSGSITAGGLVGMTNCLRHEFPNATMRTVDFDGQSDDDIATLLLTELRSNDAQPEAGYVGLERLGAATVEKPLADSAFAPHLEPKGEWVVLATGGARGITAEILEGLVRPGMRLVLLGRSSEPAPEDASTRNASDPQALRKILINAQIARGEKPKPADIDRTLSRLLADREIRANIQRLRTAGATVEYLACDVRDEKAFSALIDDVYARAGRIDVAIHGAGVIEDRLLADKTAESFERVLSTKLDAAFVLSRKLRPDSLKCLALFTSVAGRYGNRGQTDYAAANETLNRMAWDLQRRWPETRVIAINWGPWDAGMASEGVKQAFRDQGIEPIPVAAGRRMFREELALGPRHEVELVAGRGTWGTTLTSPPVNPTQASDLPLIRATSRIGPGGSMTLDHRLSLQADPYLDDHRLDGKPVMPAAGAVEWIAQFATSAWPGWMVSEVRDLRMFNGIVIDTESGRDVQLRARASSHSDPGSQAVTVEIVDAARKLPAYRATVVLVQQLPEAPLAPNLAALDGAEPFSPQRAYAEYLFHGDRFRLVDAIDALAPAGVDAAVHRSSVAHWLGTDGGDWLFDPGLMDVPPQLAIVWSRKHHEMTALPSAFGSIRRYRGSAAGPLRLLMRMRPAPHEHAVIYDAWFVDADGRVVLEMLQLEGTMSAALNRLAGQQ
ncbi:SDR family NAD(P)-dependent oxidoreductase [Sinimarinibacterium sp. CAU 1509]|uniref:type I polyketide synthase n=1 Tax=Sinimarinibacterium sp. CAU 1509 TaxID=2562283 RepID=UPI0010AC6E01|nr:type I polyketide synthase [Sinimarinibacterium sp. CAU 1509]TJY56718.1 SDR family NAD(P)-dependent oxidoreductase [Sinimarinibacterium sp. CAU 1509]